jgi:hypothetical protein
MTTVPHYMNWGMIMAISFVGLIALAILIALVVMLFNKKTRGAAVALLFMFVVAPVLIGGALLLYRANYVPPSAVYRDFGGYPSVESIDGQAYTGPAVNYPQPDPTSVEATLNRLSEHGEQPVAVNVTTVDPSRSAEEAAKRQQEYTEATQKINQQIADANAKLKQARAEANQKLQQQREDANAALQRVTEEINQKIAALQSTSDAKRALNQQLSEAKSRCRQITSEATQQFQQQTAEANAIYRQATADLHRQLTDFNSTMQRQMPPSPPQMFPNSPPQVMSPRLSPAVVLVPLVILLVVGLFIGLLSRNRRALAAVGLLVLVGALFLLWLPAASHQSQVVYNEAERMRGELNVQPAYIGNTGGLPNVFPFAAQPPQPATPPAPAVPVPAGYSLNKPETVQELETARIMAAEASSAQAAATPAESSIAEAVPAEKTAAEAVPAETTVAEAAPAESTIAEAAVSAEKTTAEATPAETAPADTATDKKLAVETVSAPKTETAVPSKPKEEAKKPLPAEMPAEPRPQPAWVNSRPDEIDGVYRACVYITPYSTELERNTEVPMAVQGALTQYVKLKLGPEAERYVKLPWGELSGCIKDQWQVSGERFGHQSTTLYLLVSFDDKIKDRVTQEWARMRDSSFQSAIAERLETAVNVVVVVLLFLTMLYGLMKLKEKKARRARLRESVSLPSP